MRIAFLLSQFPAVSETFILRQIIGLLEMGHDVRIFAEFACENGLHKPEIAAHHLIRRTTFLRMPPESARYELPVWPMWDSVWPPETGEKVSNSGRLLRCLPQFVKCLASHPRLTQEVLSSRKYGYQASSLSALYRLSALMSEDNQFDAIHAHFGPVGRSFRFARRLWQAPLIVSFHGYDFSRWPLTEGPNAYARLFDEADMITVHSDYAESRLRGLECPQSILRRLECGVDVDEFAFRIRERSADRPVRLLTVGRLVEKKGIEFSIRAVAQLLRDGYELRYEIIGDGPLRAALTALAKDLGASGQIVFSGSKDIDDVRQSMEESDIFLLASVTAADGDTEGAPVSLLEAQSSGMPIVSTRHAGIPEIVRDQESGLLAQERDVSALANALHWLLDNPGAWPEMGRRGRAFVEERHDIRKLNQRLANLYEEAAAGFKAQRRAARNRQNNAKAAAPSPTNAPDILTASQT
jgi:colanic acid/amylovoran biosynthesis glycosyltransferase